ncbi:hypothetical protein [Fluviicola chungangensis]|uniref:Uncharacterized protein n=1 Tax=Fluviicola chungangensis TaxID=2597671 RepID=A0A556N748_9FLAO|nr:hypothetical protein [Fluviicola chungangensis]TSJ47950.1 hypothetical protein FO442_02115 [Fluviicola chungangensis]
MKRILSPPKEYRKTVLSLLLLLLSLNLFGQQKLILHNKFRKKQTKELNLTYAVTVTTTLGKFDYCQLGVLNDTSLTIRSRKWVGQTYSDTTFMIPIHQVIKLEYDKMNRRKLALPATLAGMGGAVGLIALPIEAAKGNRESVASGAIVLGSLEAICLSIMYIGTRKTSYELGHKWILVVESSAISPPVR